MSKNRMDPVIGEVRIGDRLLDDTVSDGEDGVLRDKGGLLTLVVLSGFAIREFDGRMLAGSTLADGCDIATAVKPFSAIPAPTGLAIVGVGRCLGKKPVWLREQMLVRCRPDDRQGFVGRKGLEVFYWDRHAGGQAYENDEGGQEGIGKPAHDEYVAAFGFMLNPVRSGTVESCFQG